MWPLPLRPQQRQRCLNDGNGPVHIRLVHRPDFVQAGFLNRADQGIAGIVEYDIEPTKVRVGLRDSFFHLLGVRDIQRQRQYIGTRISQSNPQYWPVGAPWRPPYRRVAGRPPSRRGLSPGKHP